MKKISAVVCFVLLLAACGAKPAVSNMNSSISSSMPVSSQEQSTMPNSSKILNSTDTAEYLAQVQAIEKSGKNTVTGYAAEIISTEGNEYTAGFDENGIIQWLDLTVYGETGREVYECLYLEDAIFLQHTSEFYNTPIYVKLWSEEKRLEFNMPEFDREKSTFEKINAFYIDSAFFNPETGEECSKEASETLDHYLNNIFICENDAKNILNN